MRRGGAPFLWSAAGRAGLTFGEMLIVLAVFSILTLLFVVSSQQAMVKTRSARAASDQRVISDQILYYVTNTGVIPPDNQGLYKVYNPYKPGEKEVPLDPFSRNPHIREQYVYHSQISPVHRWVIISRGPDGKCDFGQLIEERKKQNGNLSSGAQKSPLMTSEEADRFIIENSYDPTNGTVSAGDIIRVERGM